MKPTDLTPYIWNSLLHTFDRAPLGLTTSTQRAEAWLAKQTDIFAIWDRLLNHEGIVGYGLHLHNLHQHLFHKHEVV